MKFREPRRGEWTFTEYTRVWGWKVFTTARCECTCSAVAGGSCCSPHCRTQMCPTPVRGRGRELSTLTPHRAGRKAAPWAPLLQGSYCTPTTSSLLLSTCLCQDTTNTPSRTLSLLVQVLVILIKSKVCNIRGSCTIQVICNILWATCPGDATALISPFGNKNKRYRELSKTTCLLLRQI